MVKDGSGGKDNAESEEENPFIKYASSYEPVGTVKGKEGNEPRGNPRHKVRIVSKRVRLCDPDNLVGGQKHLIDSLRALRIIPEDDPQAITLEVSQEKVSSYKDEETWLEISR